VFNKRGLSDVVVTVLVILLALTAVTIIWSFIKPAIQTAGTGIESGTARAGFILNQEDVIFDSSNDELEIILKRNNAPGEVIGYKIVITYDDEDTRIKEGELNLDLFESEKVVIPGVTDTDYGKIKSIRAIPSIKTSSGSTIVGTAEGVLEKKDLKSGNIGPQCGNNNIEGTEMCDGANLDSKTCQSEGFDSGNLGCSSDCQSFDTSNCNYNLAGTLKNSGPQDAVILDIIGGKFPVDYQLRECYQVGADYDTECFNAVVAGNMNQKEQRIYNYAINGIPYGATACAGQGNQVNYKVKLTDDEGTDLIISETCEL
jgi:ribosomal protein S8